MERRFFDLSSDLLMKRRRYLADPTRADGKGVSRFLTFTSGKPIQLHERLRLPLLQPGESLDIDFVGAGRAPIVSERVASLFRELAPNDVQLFPVDVEGDSLPYFLLNATRTLRCIDHMATTKVQAPIEHGFTQRTGDYQYDAVQGLRVAKARVGDARVFRIWGWPFPLIVDEDIKDALEANGIFGGRFEEV
ncbi:imm11 family protein [Myxococcus qinghaiensis]|uniref:imm11 family protein n=1 Tax=Myxococcus qinghaiensis TaxID=2906758 RepID=UPI0020A7672B|nr:DUF1629 domain-containing protein [Myxococcus qinghaiensis]MCP3162980.1 hypothetical protein [Myxococcus qinghaiensis]